MSLWVKTIILLCLVTSGESYSIEMKLLFKEYMNYEQSFEKKIESSYKINSLKDLDKFFKIYSQKSKKNMWGTQRTESTPQSLYTELLFKTLKHLYKRTFKVVLYKNIESIVYRKLKKTINTFVYDDYSSLTFRKHDIVYLVIKNVCKTWGRLARNQLSSYIRIVKSLKQPIQKNQPLTKLLVLSIQINKMLLRSKQNNFPKMLKKFYDNCYLAKPEADSEEKLTIIIELLKNLDLQQIEDSRLYSFLLYVYESNINNALGFMCVHFYSAILYLQQNNFQ